MAYYSSGEPPQDFFSIETNPNPAYLDPRSRIYLRRIITKGSYRDEHTYLDVQYRLLREDCYRPLRDVIRKLKGNEDTGESAEYTAVYDRVKLMRRVCLNKGVAYKIHFDVSKLGSVDWNNNKRLKFGSLLCLSSDHFHTFGFATVAESNAEDLSKGLLDIFLLRDGPNINWNFCFQMIESPAYFEAYRHVLNGLKSISNLPFKDYLINCCPKNTLPRYLQRSSDCSYKLDRSLGIKQGQNIYCSVLDKDSWPKKEDVELNQSQLRAVRYALTNRIAVIQGPPGTGKTFTALRVALALLDNRDRWCKDRTSPMLIVSCTNHALDQFLEGLHKMGCTNLVRVGSRCNSKILEKYLVHTIIRSRKCKDHLFSSTGDEIATLCDHKNALVKEICKEQRNLSSFLEDGRKPLAWSMIKTVDPLRISKITSSIDIWLGFQSDVTTEGKRLELINTKGCTLPLSEQEAGMIRNPMQLSIEKRMRLYLYWRKCLKDKYRKNLQNLYTSYHEKCDEIGKLRFMLKQTVMKDAEVVGMTTTGAAMHHKILQFLKPKIVIIEEAAEVLEAHALTSLSSATEHLLLFGDHKQLRPKPQCHDLAVRYHLNISLFERMVENNLPYRTLKVQHRMRPEIAMLLKPIYPELRNHSSVDKLNDIVGISSNVFFIKHDKPEDEISHTRSRSNAYEAKFLLSLRKYLLQQGYNGSQITILTTYNAQVSLLKEPTTEENSNPDMVSSVDGFQGEENDIILLSLVRSNESGDIGFLSEGNRVCVMLSRAKKGLFVIGNFDNLARKSKLWREIVSGLKKSGKIGPELTLECPKHSKCKALVSSAQDFESPREEHPSTGCRNLCCLKARECLHAKFSRMKTR